ncbi:MAG TPA: globin [Bacillota bacterium]|nr:globin [Bacillota bacterium]
MTWSNTTTPYEEIGGEETIEKLVQNFYPKVYADPILRPLFQDDITIIMKKQKMFLTQFLGGPPLYSQVYGPPAMRERHLPFTITPARAQAWLRCMRAAMDEIDLKGPIRDVFYERLTHVASIMVNSSDTNQ